MRAQRRRRRRTEGAQHTTLGNTLALVQRDIAYMEITEEGLHTEDIVDTGFTVDSLDEAEVARIRNRVLRGGLHGRLVAHDHSAALVVGSTTANHPDTHPDS